MVDYMEKNSNQFCADTGLFNEQGIKVQVDTTRVRSMDCIFALWNSYFLMLWFRKWLM